MKASTGKWLVAGVALVVALSGIGFLQARSKVLPDARLAALPQREWNLAAVLDNKRGVLIGRMTGGAVLSSNYFPLGGGWRVFIPIYDYVRGGDRRIEGVGVEPDIRVMPTLADIRARRDPVVERALAELRK